MENAPLNLSGFFALYGLGGDRPPPARCAGGRSEGFAAEMTEGLQSPSDSNARSDLELLHGMETSPEESLGALVHRWGPRLRRFLVRACGSIESGEDLMQEAFLRIYQAAPEFQPQGEVSSWMYRICANLAYSYWRRRQKVAFQPLAGNEPDLRSPGEPPDRSRLRARFAQELELAVASLPANHRMVFLLKIDQGLTYREIASVLCCKEGTAKSRFHYAVRSLRAALREWEGGFGPGDTGPASPLRTHRPEERLHGLHPLD